MAKPGTDLPAAWVARVPARSHRAAARLRLDPELEAAIASDGELWLRRPGSDSVPAGARAIAGLVPVLPSSAPPSAPPPTLEWQPIHAVLRATLPTIEAVEPGDARTAVPTTLERVAITLEPASELDLGAARLLRTAASRWARYVLESSRHRSTGLRFAADRQGHVFIHGERGVPPLTGDRFTVEHGIALPVGFRLAPLHRPEWLARVLRLEPEEIAIIERGDTYVRIGAREFVAASRSAVRATWPDGFDEDRVR